MFTEIILLVIKQPYEKVMMTIFVKLSGLPRIYEIVSKILINGVLMKELRI